MKTAFEDLKISRRSFLQAMGLLTLSGGLSACGSTAQTNKNALTAGSLAYALDDVVTVEFSDGGIVVSPEDAAGVEADESVEAEASAEAGASVEADASVEAGASVEAAHAAMPRTRTAARSSARIFFICIPPVQ